jgi:hypothetical protein
MKVMASHETRNEFEYAILNEDNSIVSKELADVNNNKNDQSPLLCNQSAEISAHLHSIIDLTTDNTQFSYANAVKTHLDSSDMSEKPIRETDEINVQLKSNELPHLNKIENDGFVGVERRRKRYKKFFLSGIAYNVKESQIQSYLIKRNITPTYVSIFRSRRKGTLSEKIHIPATSCTCMLEENFRPEFVICKPWQKKETQSMWSKKYSTYV